MKMTKRKPVLLLLLYCCCILNDVTSQKTTKTTPDIKKVANLGAVKSTLASPCSVFNCKSPDKGRSQKSKISSLENAEQFSPSTICSQTLYFSKFKEVQEEAGRICCSLNTTLISLTPDKLKCLQNLSPKVELFWWSSGLRLNTGKEITWCSSGQVTVNNLTTTKKSVTLRTAKKNANISFENSTMQLYFICEQTTISPNMKTTPLLQVSGMKGKIVTSSKSSLKVTTSVSSMTQMPKNQVSVTKVTVKTTAVPTSTNRIKTAAAIVTSTTLEDVSEMTFTETTTVPTTKQLITMTTEEALPTTQILKSRPDCKATCQSSLCVNDPEQSRLLLLKNIEEKKMKSLNKACGKTMYASTYTASHPEAYLTCCSMGLQLVSIESLEHRLCGLFAVHHQGLDYFVWTSGTKLCPSGQWEWCELGKTMTQDVTWYRNPTQSAPRDACTKVFSWSSFNYSVDFAQCKETLQFICEEQNNPRSDRCLLQKKPTCPVKNCESLHLNIPVEEIVAHIDKTVFRSVSTECGKTYFITKQEMTYEEAYTTCCKAGLQLIKTETDNERACLKMIPNKDVPIEVWSSASNNDCLAHWQFCGTGSMADNPDLWRGKNGPKKDDALKKNCAVAFTIVDYLLEPANCKDKKIAICEIVNHMPTIDSNLLLSSSANKLPSCGETCQQDSCQTDAKKAKDTLETRLNLKLFTKMNSACGKIVYGSTFEATHAEAYQICCSMGLQLPSIETLEHRLCGLFTVHQGSMSYFIWTSGTKLCASRKWEWCTLGKPISYPDTLWYRKPDEAGAMDSCVKVFFYSNFNFALDWTECDNRLTFYCESPETAESKRCLQQKRPTCPIENCSNEKVNAVSTNGMTFKTSKCGKTFYLGQTKLSYEDALKACCQAGKQLIKISSIEDQNCLNQLSLNEMPASVWTSATCSQCWSHWEFCGTGISADNTTIFWKGGTGPDKDRSLTQHCAVALPKENFVLSQAECSEKVAFLCEG